MRSPNGSQSKNVNASTAAITTAKPRPRGRPPKVATNAPASEPVTAAAHVPAPTKVGRGRPKKINVTAAEPLKTSSAKRKRNETTKELAAEQPPAKKRGRPPGSLTATPSAPTKPRKQRAVKVQDTQTTKPKTTATKTKTAAAKPVRKRGRPVGSSSAQKPVAKDETTKALPKTSKTAKSRTAKNETLGNAPEGEGALIEEHENNEGTQYWLMKAEPDTRIIKGVDVSFGIDKLAAAREPEPWDGK